MRIIKVYLIEIWKQIKLYKDGSWYNTDYLISNKGRVQNSITGKILKPNNDGQYLQVAIFLNGKRKMCKIHRLVAEAFLINKYKKKCVNHKNGNKLINFAINLEWNTYSENNKHAYDTGLKRVGEDNSKANHSNEFIITICTLLQSGFKPKYIKLTLGYKVSDPHISKLISKIKHRKHWTHISKDYKW